MRRLAGRLVDRAGPRLAALAGALLTAAGLVLLAFVDRSASAGALAASEAAPLDPAPAAEAAPPAPEGGQAPPPAQ